MIVSVTNKRDLSLMFFFVIIKTSFFTQMSVLVYESNIFTVGAGRSRVPADASLERKT